jgi:hypothetical protein
MWASSIAAGIMQLKLERSQLAVFNCDGSLGDACLIHYCYDHGGFYKQRFKPAHDIPIATSSSEAMQRLIKLISERFASS